MIQRKHIGRTRISKEKVMFKRKKKTSNEALEVKNETIIIKDETKSIEHLAKVNDLLKYVTELDYIKDMLIRVNKQTETINNIAATSQQMTASIEDISDFVQNSSQTTAQSIEIANESLYDIADAFRDIVINFEASKKVQETMSHVNKEAQKINDMVTIIQGVAEQTNLLALNASIEAARAGEHGKGFAVVANEIKKLAENTKEQVTYINSTVLTLSEKIAETSSALEESNKNFETSKDKMDTAVNNLDKLHEGLQNISHSFVEISANVEEQTAASEETSSAIMIVNEETQSLQTEINKTGRAIHMISTIINKIRLDVLGEIDELDLKTQLEICMTDHLIWRWRVYNMILGFEQLSEDQVGTHHTCRLGKWADSAEFDNQSMVRVIKEMNSPHEALHNFAKKSIQAYNHGDQSQAEAYLKDIDQVSAQVISHLEKLKTIAKKEL